MADDTKQTPPATKTASVLFGIPQLGLTHVDRQVPVDEPPPMPRNSALKYVGQPTVRYDGAAKASGRGKYTADIHLPGMLYAYVLGAGIPHGRVLSVDTSAAERLSGGEGGARHRARLRGFRRTARSQARGAFEISDRSLCRSADCGSCGDLAGRRGRCGEADRGEVRRDAVRSGSQDARHPDAPLVFPGPADEAGSAGGGGGPKDVPQVGNVHGPEKKTKGDAGAGFKEADVVVEGEYFTQVQTHSALETHGFVVDWKPDEVTVYASTQGTASVRDEFADVFKLPKTKVRVITEFMGGGFGAKFGAGNEGVVAANLSRKANAPVKLMLDRRQEHIVCNRPDSHQKLKIGAKHDGTLTAIELISYGTAGVGTGAGTAGPATNLYKCANLLTEEYDVFINAGPGAAFRAPGHPQGCFAFEQTIDDLAVKLNMDPLDLRDKIDESPARKVERQIIREKTNWRNRKPAGADTGPVKRGMGIAQSVWYRFVNMDSSCEVRVCEGWLGRTDVGRAGYRRRHEDDACAGCRGGVRHSSAERAGAHRRHSLSHWARIPVAASRRVRLRRPFATRRGRQSRSSCRRWRSHWARPRTISTCATGMLSGRTARDPYRCAALQRRCPRARSQRGQLASRSTRRRG